MHKRIKILSASAAFFMLLILLGGALVSKTDSGKACGDTWPLCNGQFIPSFTIPELIEYSHRIITGIFSILLLATVILVFMYVKRADARWFAIGASAFTILQAFLGALAALKEQSSLVMALHFGFSLIAFAFTFLLAIVFTKWGDYIGKAAQRVKTFSGSFQGLVWFTLVYCYVVVYLGAYVRHTNSSAGCLGWPLCNGELIPEFGDAAGIVFIHRVAAFLLLVLLVLLFSLARKHYSQHEKLYKSSRLALTLVILQILSGAFVTLTVLNEDWHLIAALVHAVLISGLFTVLVYIGVLTIYAQRANKTGEGSVRDTF